MGIDTLVRKVDQIIMKTDKNTLKLFVVRVPLIFSGLGTYYAIEYALKGEYGKTIVAGICTIVNAYSAGFQYKNIDSRENPHTPPRQ
ncbi:hypothetical protein HYX14_04195 [Candidatus Woesearchaeota archaeon]|nr:hypothetical protein [Candidatus Woesearchaeota archaeon]